MAAAAELRALLSARATVAAIFASAPSQDDFLAHLRAQPGIDWPRVSIFHLDEYIGLSPTHPASFRRYLREHLVQHVPAKEFFELDGQAPDLEAECDRYAALLNRHEPAMAAIGIGENGHLAFIDPANCDFDDARQVRAVELDEVCRIQQVHDGAFSSLEHVPRRALSMTIPAIFRAPRIVVNVPGSTKREAVKAALDGPIGEACPASVLRRHTQATLYLDEDSAALL